MTPTTKPHVFGEGIFPDESGDRQAGGLAGMDPDSFNVDLDEVEVRATGGIDDEDDDDDDEWEEDDIVGLARDFEI